MYGGWFIKPSLQSKLQQFLQWPIIMKHREIIQMKYHQIRQTKQHPFFTTITLSRSHHPQ